MTEQDLVEKILDACRRINAADPAIDADAQNDLYVVGKKLFDIGYEEHMLEVLNRAEAVAVARGHCWMVGSLCNSTWDGIGYWRK